MLTVYRIVKASEAERAFEGLGVQRWNSPDVPVVYTAATRALAMLELLVHVDAEDLGCPYVIFPVSFEEGLVEWRAVDQLPRGWRKNPPPRGLRKVGDGWAASGRSAVLAVPSTVVPFEFNFLLNPRHGRWGEVAVGRRERLLFDGRLAGKAAS